ncbi:MAG: helix-hairpin-helix domain-containing protein [Candidatus Omnitrophota bacterium]
MIKRTEVIKKLQVLRNIGPKTAEKLYTLGIMSADQMKKSNPEILFEKIKQVYKKADPCELYVFRGAILDVPWWECKDVNMRKKRGVRRR